MKAKRNSSINRTRIITLAGILFASCMIISPTQAGQEKRNSKDKPADKTQTSRIGQPGKDTCNPNIELCGHDEGHQDPPINARMSLTEPNLDHLEHDDEIVVSCPATVWTKFTFKAKKQGEWHYRFVTPNSTALTSFHSPISLHQLMLDNKDQMVSVKYAWNVGESKRREGETIHLQLLTKVGPAHAKKDSQKVGSRKAKIPPAPDRDLITIGEYLYVVSEEKSMNIRCQ